MAPPLSREERHLLRQRGAGTKVHKTFDFGLSLGIPSKSQRPAAQSEPESNAPEEDRASTQLPPVSPATTSSSNRADKRRRSNYRSPSVVDEDSEEVRSSPRKHKRRRLTEPLENKENENLDGSNPTIPESVRNTQEASRAEDVQVPRSQDSHQRIIDEVVADLSAIQLISELDAAVTPKKPITREFSSEHAQISESSERIERIESTGYPESPEKRRSTQSPASEISDISLPPLPHDSEDEIEVVTNSYETNRTDESTVPEAEPAEILESEKELEAENAKSTSGEESVASDSGTDETQSNDEGETTSTPQPPAKRNYKFRDRKRTTPVVDKNDEPERDAIAESSKTEEEEEKEIVSSVRTKQRAQSPRVVIMNTPKPSEKKASRDSELNKEKSKEKRPASSRISTLRSRNRTTLTPQNTATKDQSLVTSPSNESVDVEVESKEEEENEGEQMSSEKSSPTPQPSSQKSNRKTKSSTIPSTTRRASKQPSPPSKSKAKKTRLSNRKVKASSSTPEVSARVKMKSYPITVQRLVNTKSLPQLPTPPTSSDPAEPSDHIDPFPHNHTITSVDVLAQFSNEQLEKMVSAMEAASANEPDRRRNTELRHKIDALHAFGSELETRLFEMSEALIAQQALQTRLKEARKRKQALLSEFLGLKNQKQDVLLAIEAFRKEHLISNQREREDAELNELVWDLSMVVERGRMAEAKEKEAGNGEDEGDVPNTNATLEEKINAVIDSGMVAMPGRNGGGLLEKVKEFNGFLEEVAAALEGSR